jgi:hypothetical protein
MSVTTLVHANLVLLAWATKTATKARFVTQPMQLAEFVFQWGLVAQPFTAALTSTAIQQLAPAKTVVETLVTANSVMSAKTTTVFQETALPALPAQMLMLHTAITASFVHQTASAYRTSLQAASAMSVPLRTTLLHLSVLLIPCACLMI